MTIRTALRVGAALVIAGMCVIVGAHAASRSGGASLTIYRPLSVQQTSGLSFGHLHNKGGNATNGTVTISATPPATRTATGTVNLLGGGSISQMVLTISGEPGRVYRVSLPASVGSTPGGLSVSSFTLWSAVRGSLGATALGQLNASGQDTLRIGATLAVPKNTDNDTFGANVPVTVSYE